MPKVAVLISGEYRTFAIARNTMAFLDDPEIDVYFSTWDTTIYSLPKLRLKIIESVSHNRIQAALGRPAKILIENQSQFKRTDRYNNQMIHRWLAGFQLIKDSGISYDYVIIIRPDLIFNNSVPPTLNQIEQYKESIGAVWSNSLHQRRLTDVLLISSFDNINKLFSNLSIDVWETAEQTDWHIWWYEFGLSQGLNFIDTPDLNHSTFCRMWVRPDHTFNEIVEIQSDWRDLVLLNQVDQMGRDFVSSIWPDHVLPAAEEKWNQGYFDKYK